MDVKVRSVHVDVLFQYNIYSHVLFKWMSRCRLDGDRAASTPAIWINNVDGYQKLVHAESLSKGQVHMNEYLFLGTLPSRSRTTVNASARTIYIYEQTKGYPVDDAAMQAEHKTDPSKMKKIMH